MTNIFNKLGSTAESTSHYVNNYDEGNIIFK